MRRWRRVELTSARLLGRPSLAFVYEQWEHRDVAGKGANTKWSTIAGQMEAARHLSVAYPKPAQAASTLSKKPGPDNTSLPRSNAPGSREVTPFNGVAPMRGLMPGLLLGAAAAPVSRRRLSPLLISVAGATPKTPTG